MSNSNARFWDKFFKSNNDFVDALDSVVNEKYLTITEQFSVNRSGYLLLIVWTDVGKNWVAFFRRCCDVRHFANAGNSHL